MKRRILEFFLKVPYSIAWRIANSQNYSFPVIFYCTSFKDYKIFLTIRNLLPELTIVAENRKIQETLLKEGIISILMPVYPKLLITLQDIRYKFPSKQIKKIRIDKADMSNEINRIYDHKGYHLYLQTPYMPKDVNNRIAQIINDFVKECGLSF